MTDLPPTTSNKICPKCHMEHNKSGTYCSRSCANARRHKNETKIAISNALRGKASVRKGSEFPYTRVTRCKVCGKFFECRKNKRIPSTCSDKCKLVALSIAGRKAASMKIVRSADEIRLYDLCVGRYGLVTHNDPMFNGWDADILIHDLQIAILWNGPWHYQTMPGLTHSLSQVRNRDRIKVAEIEKMGWTALIFEDRAWSVQSAFDEILRLESTIGTHNCVLSLTTFPKLPTEHASSAPA